MYKQNRHGFGARRCSKYVYVCICTAVTDQHWLQNALWLIAFTSFPERCNITVLSSKTQLSLLNFKKTFSMGFPANLTLFFHGFQGVFLQGFDFSCRRWTRFENSYVTVQEKWWVSGHFGIAPVPPFQQGLLALGGWRARKVACTAKCVEHTAVDVATTLHHHPFVELFGVCSSEQKEWAPTCVLMNTTQVFRLAQKPLEDFTQAIQHRWWLHQNLTSLTTLNIACHQKMWGALNAK